METVAKKLGVSMDKVRGRGRGGGRGGVRVRGEVTPVLITPAPVLTPAQGCS
jgi:hypothetical protein